MNIEFHRTRSRPNEEVDLLLFLWCIMQPHNLETRETAPSNNCTVKLKMPLVSILPAYLANWDSKTMSTLLHVVVTRELDLQIAFAEIFFFNSMFTAAHFFFRAKNSTEKLTEESARSFQPIDAHHRCCSGDQRLFQLITNCAMNQRKKAGRQKEEEKNAANYLCSWMQ